MLASTPPRTFAEVGDHVGVGVSAKSVRKLWPIYLVALGGWIATRWLMLLHQGAWPWMNGFVMNTARDMVAGDWSEAVRPPLPALLAVPLLLAGAPDDQAVAVLYLLASLVQFAAFALFVHQVFRGRDREQVLALLLFLLVPINHSIHHFRNTPTVLGSSAIFLLGAHWMWVHAAGARRIQGLPSVAWVVVAIALGVLSRTEMLTFIAGLLTLGSAMLGRRVSGVAAQYLLATVAVLGLSIGLSQVAGADPRLAARYQVHTFLDSTPASWLTPDCQAAPTENCRDREGAVQFGPVDRDAGVLRVVLDRPFRTLAKTAQSGWDNMWALFGANPSTFPTMVWFGALALLACAPCRAALRSIPRPAWPTAGAALATSVLPPLSWAPAHPQYHLHMLLPVMLLAVPILAALLPLSRGRVLLAGFFLANAALSAFRYTRYAGY